MPYRQIEIQATVSHVLEGVTLGSLLLWQGTKAVVLAITEQDWGRIMGPNGVAVVSILAVIVLWGALLTYIHRTGKREEKRRKEELEAREADDAARERRHKEVMDLQARHAEVLTELTTQSIRASIQGTAAIETLARNVRNLTIEIKDNPCQVKMFQPQPSCPAPATQSL